MSMVVRWKSGVATVVAVAAFVACQADRNGFSGDSKPLIPDAGDDGAAAPFCAGLVCSRDLHQVLDGCTNTVVKQCDPDLACSGGACVPACDSAAKALGSIGCSYWTTPPDAPYYGETSCYAVFVANTMEHTSELTAELGSDPLDISKSIYRAIGKAIIARLRAHRGGDSARRSWDRVSISG